MSKLTQVFSRLGSTGSARYGRISGLARSGQKLFAGIVLLALCAIGPVHALTTLNNNFTMLDGNGDITGGTNDVTFTWDETFKSSVAVSGQVSNATLSSPTPFFGVTWSAHDVAIYGPGTYVFYTGCGAGAPGCGTGPTYTLTVGPGQVGAHMLFDWNGNLNIDVVVLWNRNQVFGPSPLRTGGGNTALKVWDLMSIDTPIDADAFNGTQMLAPGPFPGFSANFNLMAAVPTAGSLSTTTPSAGSADVAITSGITLTFDRSMNAASVAAAFSLVGPGSVSVAGTMSPNTGNATTFNFVPTSPLAYNTAYTATLASTARDASGLALIAGATNPWTFTTELPPVSAGSLVCNAATPGVFTGVFTMLDPLGGRVGRDVGVTGTWDGTVNTAANGTNFNMTLASPNPFFGATWTTHDVRVFGPGTYTINTGCSPAELRSGVAPASCAIMGQMMTFTVNAGQLGAHMLFDWSGNNNISVVNVWNRNTRSSCVPSAVPLKAADGSPVGYGLAVTDVNSDNIAGLPMAATSPFPSFNANFDLYPGSAGSATAATLPGAGSAGGGCVIAGNRSKFDPVLLVIVLLGIARMALGRRR